MTLSLPVWVSDGFSAGVHLCRKYGVSDATFYAWRKKYGGLGAEEAAAEAAPDQLAAT